MSDRPLFYSNSFRTAFILLQLNRPRLCSIEPLIAALQSLFSGTSEGKVVFLLKEKSSKIAILGLFLIVPIVGLSS